MGTKRQAQDAIKEEAVRCNQFYVNQRWLGGLLTNFQTIQKSIKRFKDIEAMQADGASKPTRRKSGFRSNASARRWRKTAGIKEMESFLTCSS